MLKKLKLNLTLLLSVGLLLGLTACSKPTSDKKAQKLILGTWKYEDLAEVTFEEGNKASVKLTSSGLSSISEAFKSPEIAKLLGINGAQQAAARSASQTTNTQSDPKQLIEKLGKSLDASYTITKDKLTITGKQKKDNLVEKLQSLPLFQNVIELFPEEGKPIELSIQKLTKKELEVTSGSGKKYSLKK